MLNKKPPTNPKYADVKSVIDHGKSMKDVEIISDQLIAKKRGENFGRIKPSTLSKFLTDSNNEESVYGLMTFQENKENNFDNVSVAHSVQSHKSDASVVSTSANQL